MKVGIAIAASLSLCGFALAQPVAAPPRDVADVLVVLESYKPDPAAVAKLRAAAAAEAPANASERELAVFYHLRARARSETGDTVGEIADLDKALSHAPGLARRGVGERSDILREVYQVEFRAGNYPKAIAASREMITLDATSGRAMGAWLGIESASIQMGDMKAAEEAVDRIEAIVTRLRRNYADWLNFENNTLKWREMARGRLLEARGNYGVAEHHFRKALEHAEKDVQDNEVRIRANMGAITRPVAQRYWAETEGELAANLRAQGRLAEAEYYSRRALLRSLETFGRYNLTTAAFISSLALVVHEQGRFADAEKLARVAVETYQASGVPRSSVTLAQARAVLGAVLVAQERWPEAVALFEERDRDLASDAQQYERLRARDDLGWAIALVRTGQAAKAAPMLDRIYEGRRARGVADDDYALVEMRGFRALGMAATGRKPEAFGEFRAAVPVLLEASRHGASSEDSGVARQQRLTWLLEGYLALLWDLRDGPELRAAGLDAAAESFRIADVARGSVVQRALAASAARSVPSDPALAELARREQDALQRLTTLGDLVNRLLAAPPEQKSPAIIEGLRKEIAALTAERAQLRKDLAQRFPEYAQLTEPKPVSAADIAAALAPQEALVAIYSAPSSAYVWAIRRGRPVAFAASPIGEAEIAQAVAKLRKAVDPGDEPPSAWTPFDVALAYSLYAKLLKPVEAGWQGASTLLVVPHKTLGQLPFGLLVTAPHQLGAPAQPQFAEFRAVPWLIRQAGIVQLPTASTLVTLRRAPARAGSKPFVGIGDPVFRLAAAEAAAGGETRRGGPVRRNLSIAAKASADGKVNNSAGLAQLAPLPDTADEVLEIAKALGVERNGNVFLGTEASERNVKSGILLDRRIVVFATHGLVPGDLDGLTQPALALSAPRGARAPGDDGLLTLDEILSLKLNADWVVLSACNTASADGGASEAVSGLGRGFFYAGARSLLVSNWPVETVSARLITTGVFARQAKDPSQTRAEALRQQLLQMIDKEAGNGFTYAHPLFWAPFSLVGDGGR